MQLGREVSTRAKAEEETGQANATISAGAAGAGAAEAGAAEAGEAEAGAAREEAGDDLAGEEEAGVVPKVRCWILNVRANVKAFRQQKCFLPFTHILHL